MSACGLVPVLALAESAGLRDLADEHLTVPTDKGANVAGGLVDFSLHGSTAHRTGGRAVARSSNALRAVRSS